jgi:hypothetical protein
MLGVQERNVTRRCPDCGENYISNENCQGCVDEYNRLMKRFMTSGLGPKELVDHPWRFRGRDDWSGDWSYMLFLIAAFLAFVVGWMI